MSESQRPVNGAFLDWDTFAKVTCHGNCSYQKCCLLDAYIKDGVVVRVEQASSYPHQKDPEVPDWAPKGCSKGLVYTHRMYDPCRIPYPVKRVGARGAGQWQRLSWDQALTEIADGFIDVLSNDGPEAAAYFGGSAGTLGTEGMSFEVLRDLLGIPASNVTADIGDDHQGAAECFGQPFMGSSADNWFYADIILIWGGNPSYTNITNYHFITEARYKGTKVITISPDYSPSALPADLWIPVNIGTDVSLALAMAQVIISENLYKPSFVREQTDLPLLVRQDNHRYLRESDLKRGGRDDVFYFWDTHTNALAEAPRLTLGLGNLHPALDGEHEVNTLQGKVRVTPVLQRLKLHLEAYTPEKASPITGVAPGLIRQLARDFATARGVVNISTFNWGKFYHGNLIERAIVFLFVLCGHLGRRGACYNGFTQLAQDASVSGAAIRGSVLLQAAASGDPRFIQWREQGYTDEMILIEYARQAWEKGSIVASSFFHFIHSGLLEQATAHNSWDPHLKRPVAEYLQEALDKGWQFITPRPGKDPRLVINMGGSFLRRSRATSQIIRTLLPKLKMLLTVDFRWNSTALYSDYVLPASGWFEKYQYILSKVEFPYAFVINKAVEPLHESKGEWEIWCLLAKRIQERALQRGILTFAGPDGTQRRLDNLYDRVTINGTYFEEDEEAVCRDYYYNTDNVAQIPWEDFKEKGLVPATGVGKTFRSIGNACDVVPGEPLIPLTWHTDKKQPYPTLTRRIHFYIDHELYLELDESFPVQKTDPKVGGDYPLRMTGGHARQSIHSIHVDDAIVLRLGRGGPTMFMSRSDARARGINDGDVVEAFNDVASFRVIVSVSAGLKPRQVIMYHAWENYQFPGKNHFKSVMAGALNPVELAGGNGHTRPMPVCFYPGTSDRETMVEVRRVE